MTEAELVEQMSPLPVHDHLSFVPADPSLAPWSFSRAYINIQVIGEVISFRDRFDGYVFVDNRGNEYAAIVELAPCQKISKKKPKRDAKCNTLEDDPEYKKYLESLASPSENGQTSTVETCLEELEKRDRERRENKQAKVKTPLTEYIAEKKQEKLRRQLEKKKQKEEERKRRLELEKLQREREKAQRKKEAAKASAQSSRFLNEKKKKPRDQEAGGSGELKFVEEAEIGDYYEGDGYEYSKHDGAQARRKATTQNPEKKKQGWYGKYDDYGSSGYQESYSGSGSGSKARSTGGAGREKDRPAKSDTDRPPKEKDYGRQYQQERPQQSHQRSTATKPKQRFMNAEEEKETGDGNEAPNASREKKSTKTEPRQSEKPSRSATTKESDASKDQPSEQRQRYRDKPSMQLYQPGRRKAATEEKKQESPGK